MSLFSIFRLRARAFPPPNAASESTRTRTGLAFLCALGIVVTAVASLATDIRSVFAFTEESAASFFRNDRARMGGGRSAGGSLSAQPHAAARPFAVTVPVPDRAARQVKAASAAAKKVRQTKLARQEPAAANAALSSSSGSRSVCVRLCDGFHFPVGHAPAGGSVAAHESVCSATCPDAPTRLFILPAGTDDISQAYSPRSGQKYSALPVALRHADKRDKTCSCRRNAAEPAAGDPMAMVSLYRDFTLRRGDAVMTNRGFRVFRGARKWPYKPNDFGTLNGSGLAASERRLLQSLEKASIPGRITSREQPRATPRTTANPVPLLGPFSIRKPHQNAAVAPAATIPTGAAKTAQAAGVQVQ